MSKTSPTPFSVRNAMNSEGGSNLSYCLRGQTQRAEICFPLSRGENRIGRSETNDLLIFAPNVSRHHARLLVDSEGLELRDLESRNGTYVNGKPILRCCVLPGDTIAFGGVKLHLEEVEQGDTELGLELHRTGSRMDQVSTKAILKDMPWFDPGTTPLVFPPRFFPGTSITMKSLYRSMRSLLDTDLPILIEGETGVGKELVARIFHLSSNRQEKPFVAINCAAIPANLLESELFGVGEGVATGVRKRVGRIRAAQGGTLFLDELGEMPLKLQAKLLRVLQEKEVQPLGEAPTRMNVRILAATNIDLLAQVEAGAFRQDLYYRVAGTILSVPPLRDRCDDIPHLIQHFLEQEAEKSGKRVRGLTVQALSLLQEAPWPGNVRQLEHEIRRLANLCVDGQVIDSRMLAGPLHPREFSPSGNLGYQSTTNLRDFSDSETRTQSLRLKAHVARVEDQVIRRALVSAEGSQRKAARLLGISRNTLLRKLKTLDIQFE